jgi:hypothetical protein
MGRKAEYFLNPGSRVIKLGIVDPDVSGLGLVEQAGFLPSSFFLRYGERIIQLSKRYDFMIL